MIRNSDGSIDTETFVCREGDNRIDRTVLPVVFVPGVMGSRLRFPTIDEYWDPDSNTRMSHWLRISAGREAQELATTTPATVMAAGATKDAHLTAEEEQRGWAGLAWRSYGVFLRWFAGIDFSLADCPLHACGYDWRQSNRTSADALAASIRTILGTTGADRFLLISHSMGGLVSRTALKLHGDVAAKVAGVLHVVQPAIGATVLYRRLFTGARSDIDGGWGFSTILGNTGPKFSAVMTGLSGPMELLPNDDLRDTDGGPWLRYFRDGRQQAWEGGIYEHYLSAESPPGMPDSDQARNVRDLLQRQVRSARFFHRDVLAGYAHPRTWAIYSTGVVTDTAVEFEFPAPPVPLDPGAPSGGVPDPAGSAAKPAPPRLPPTVGLRRAAEGDGTVPQASGQSLFPTQAHAPPFVIDDDFLRQYVVNGVEHEPAFADGTVQGIVEAWVRKLLAEG